MSRPSILIAEPMDFSPRALELLRSQADVELGLTGPFAAALAGHECLWFRLAHRIDAALIAERGRCRVIATPVTGIDHIDVEACRKAGVKVVSLKGEVEFLKEVKATAELTVALAMALMRRIVPAAESVKGGAWQRDLFRGRELSGKTVGLVGVGRLGTLVAGYFAAFGMKVLGYDTRADLPPGVERCASLDELLGKSDLVSVHVSLNDSSRGLFGERAFAAMRPGAWFVNTARGDVVDETALLKALESGRLAGAAIDVVSGEPNVGAEHALVRYAKKHEDLLLVPHIGGNTSESFEKTELFLAGKVLEALR